MVNYMLHYQGVFLKLQQKFLLKKDTLKKRMKILPKMLFIRIFCYLRNQVLFILFMCDTYTYLYVSHKLNEQYLIFKIKYLYKQHFW